MKEKDEKLMKVTKINEKDWTKFQADRKDERY